MKSHESDLLDLATCIYNDAVAKCTDVSLDHRDLNTLKSRVEHEGLSFLTITLPTFGKDFDLSLASGQIDPASFRAFKRSKGRAPAFLRGFLDHVFDENGRIKNEPSVEAIEAIRQIAYAYKKLQVPCTPQRVRRALTKFASNEHVFQVPLLQDDTQVFLECSRVIWGSVFNAGDTSVFNTTPKHGPGATAEKLSGNAKYTSQRWHDRLEPYFPLLDTAFVNSNAVSSEGFKKVAIIEEADEQPVRVIAVPKTLKTPRIIAIEPVCMQYTQQALAELVIDRLESHELTRGHVNFTDQSVNRDIAMKSSENGKSATLDLSSASDLVPYELAIRMFDECPELQGAISACRSKTAQLPSGDVISLKKFASMGSALCFPVEAMYFYTICVVALLKKHNLPCTYLNVKHVKKGIYVYGDDIIVPTGASDIVTDTLQKYYCEVNVRKSFSTGKFRESCGMDAYAGEEVTPTYVRHPRPCDKRATNALVSWIATSNLFYKRGFWRTSSLMLKHVERVLGELPVVGPECEGLGKQSFQPAVSIERWNTAYQCPEVKTWVAQPIYRQDRLDGWQALLKSLLNLERRESDSQERAKRAFQRAEHGSITAVAADEKHLERSARHGAVALRRRWVRPY